MSSSRSSDLPDLHHTWGSGAFRSQPQHTGDDPDGDALIVGPWGDTAEGIRDESWMLEIATGQFWPRDPVGMAGIDEPDDFDDPDSFTAVVGLGSGPGYGDMRDFIGTVTDDALAGRLSVAIQGRGAFRRFKDALFPNEGWWGAWLTFSNERQLGRARWWLADAGLHPATDDESAGS